MKPKNVFLVVFLCLIFSCAKESDQQQDILSKPEMANLLIDIHLLEVKLSKLKVTKDSMRKIYNRFQQGILDERGITRDKYDKSFEYYMSLPNEMEQIYTVVVDSLNLMEQKITLQTMKKEEEERKTKHSPKSSRSIRQKADSLPVDSAKVRVEKPESN